MKKIILDKFAIELDGMVQWVETLLPENPGSRFRLSWTTYSQNDQLIDVSGEVFVSDQPRFRVTIRPKSAEVAGTKIQLTAVATWEDPAPASEDKPEADEQIDKMLVEAGFKIFGREVRAARKTDLNGLADDINTLFQKKFKGGGK